jgi:hypothetical protein
VKKLWPLMKTPCECGHLGAEHHPERQGFGPCTFATATRDDDGVLQVNGCPCEWFTPLPDPF